MSEPSHELRPLERYLAVRRFVSLTCSADGGEVAYVSDISGQWNVWRTGLAAGATPVQRTFFEEEVCRTIAWSPVRDAMIVAADVHGDENHALYLCEGSDGWPVALTDDPAAKHHISARAWSPDGTRIAFSANDREPQDFDVCVRDMADGRYYFVLRWTPDGSALLLADPSSNDDVRLRLVEVASGEVRDLTPWDGKFVADVQGVSSADGRVLLATNRDREFLGLAWLDIDSLELDWIETPDHDIDAAALSQDGTRLAFCLNVDGASRLHVRDVAGGREYPVPDLPVGLVEDLQFTPDGNALVFRANASVRPNAPYLLDLEAGSVRRLEADLLGAIVPDDLVAPETVRIESFDGRPVQAWLYRPPGASADAPVPAVLSIHGGPEAQERPYYYPLYQYLLHRGIAVLAPNIRGSTGFGASWQRLIHRDWGGDDLRDMAACAQFLKNADWIDGERLAVYGGSYGGFASLSCMSRLPEYWAAGVSIVGPSNLVTFVKSVPPAWQRFMKQWVGDPEEDHDMLMRRSPITYVDRVKAPLLVLQGAQDPRVVKAESDQMVERLEKRGVPVEYHVFNDEGHGFTKKRNQVKAWKLVADFLGRHLHGDGASEA
ncbi:MAG: S9 family peptidase [Planctomycetota bacterium]|jgi:dipeptidyl aminopeptidase/acylaminoacyl peptidase